jgi:hypothetical protein
MEKGFAPEEIWLLPAAYKRTYLHGGSTRHLHTPDRSPIGQVKVDQNRNGKNEVPWKCLPSASLDLGAKIQDPPANFNASKAKKVDRD